MGWNLYKGLELCKPEIGDKKGKGKVLLSVAAGWEPSWGWRGGPLKDKIMPFLLISGKSFNNPV